MKKILILLGATLMALASASNTMATPMVVASGEDVLPTPPTFSFNVGVQAIDTYTFRMAHEMTKMPSARVTSIGIEDKGRIDAMYAQLVSTINEVGIQGQTCSTDFSFLYPVDLTDMDEPMVPVENEAINTAVAYLYRANIDMRLSQSSKLNDCLTAPDYGDLGAAVAKSKIFIDNFYASHNPMDMPQSHPRRDIVEPTAAGAAFPIPSPE